MSEVESAINPATNAEAEQEPKTVTQTVDDDEDMKEEVTSEIEKMVTETVDEDGDVVEETTEVKRKTIKRTMKITEAGRWRAAVSKFLLPTRFTRMICYDAVRRFERIERRRLLRINSTRIYCCS
ncbi:unnamed protein product [Ceratitis capitata]|uniref:(Mediterranean fruit fly) hypothetical protein n=1 Tax=Ceratitis capitata TaxID=7213 RepID=A0A811U1Q2_CERCA|nr:unnamed protein product [Ceratitis capitata]